MTRAYSYLRFSTPEQAAGDSRRRQLAASEAYAREHGLTLDTSLRDEGVSGFRGRNRTEGALSRFLETIRAGRVPEGSYLLVENLDRLSRERPLVAFATLTEIVESGIVVVTMSDRKVYSKQSLNEGSTIFDALVEIVRSNKESSRKSDLVGKAWAAKRVDAKSDKSPMTRWCPAWLRVEGDVRRRTAKYVEIPERVAVVREVFALSIDGLGTDAIAGRLNARGEPTWGVGKKRGKIWHSSYIQKLLSGRAVLGDSEVPGRDPIADLYPRVIDDDTYYRARAVAAERRVGPSGVAKGGQGSYRNIFSGIATCKSCGGGMHYLQKGAKSSGPVLVCGASRMRGCDNRRPYDYGQLERFIVTSLPHAMSAAERERVSDSTSQIAIATSALDVARAKLTDIENRLRSVIEACEAGAGAALAPTLIKLQGDLEAAKTGIETAEIGARFATDDTRKIDIGMLMRRLKEGPESRPGVHQVLRRTITNMTCDDAGNVSLTTANGGRGSGRIRAQPDPKWNPGRLTSQDGRRRKDDAALVEAMSGGKEVATKPKIARKRKNTYAPRTTRPAFGSGSAIKTAT